jgi:hypothetical protein
VKDIKGVAGSQWPLGVAPYLHQSQGRWVLGWAQRGEGVIEHRRWACRSGLGLSRWVGGWHWVQQQGEGGIHIGSSPQSEKEVGQASMRGRGNKVACGIHATLYYSWGCRRCKWRHCRRTCPTKHAGTPILPQRHTPPHQEKHFCPRAP